MVAAVREAPKSDEKKVKVRELRPLTEIWPIGYVHGLRSVIVPKGTTRADLVNPLLWSVVGDHLKSFDVVHVVAADDTFFARILVRAKEPEQASAPQLIELEYVELPPRNMGKHELAPGYEIRFIAAEGGYEAWRLKPNEVRVSGSTPRLTWEDARTAINDDARRIAPTRQTVYAVDDE